MRRYAQETAVSVEKSKAEIETMLNRYGATAFMSGTNQTEAVGFVTRVTNSVPRNRNYPTISWGIV